MNELERMNARACAYMWNPNNNIESIDKIKIGDVLRKIWYINGHKCIEDGMVIEDRRVKVPFDHTGNEIADNVYIQKYPIDYEIKVNYYNLEMIEILYGEEAEKVKRRIDKLEMKRKKDKQLSMF